MGAIAQQSRNQQIEPLNPKDKMKRLLERSWPRISAVIPKEMNSDRLYQMYVSTINREPELANCSVESVLACFMRLTSIGLEPSNVNGLGMAYILPYGNKNMRTGQKEATLIIGYKGMINLARRSREVKSINSVAVYEDDGIDLYMDESGQPYIPEGQRINPKADHSPEKLLFVYFSADFNNGGHYRTYMTREEIDRIRSRSRAGSKGPWVTDYSAMARKTVVRRAFPYLPVSVEARTAVAEDETTPDYDDILHPVITPDPTPVDDVQTHTAEVHDDPNVVTTTASNNNVESEETK